MSGSVFYIVDVFAERKYAGNQLAVVLDGWRYTAEEMQRIAKEINFSETTFMMSDAPVDGAYPVRIFTPAEELPFAGHPTLGTAYIIQREVLKRQIPSVTLALGVGHIPVTIDYKDGQADMLRMRHNQPSFDSEPGDRALFASMLGLTAAELSDTLPIEMVSTGLPTYIVPVRSLSALRNCRINGDIYWNFVEASPAKMILAFAPEALEAGNDLHVRVFVDFLGIPEDPATGSAAGALASYLLKHNMYGPAFQLRAEQGYSVNRPSILELHGSLEDGRFAVHIGGRCFVTAKGEWL